MPLIKTSPPTALKCKLCGYAHDISAVDKNALFANIRCKCGAHWQLTPGKVLGWRFPNSTPLADATSTAFPDEWGCPSCATRFNLSAAIPSDAKAATFCCSACNAMYELAPHPTWGWAAPAAKAREKVK